LNGCHEIPRFSDSHTLTFLEFFNIWGSRQIFWANILARGWGGLARLKTQNPNNNNSRNVSVWESENLGISWHPIKEGVLKGKSVQLIILTVVERTP
jgi:hypothetical protein